MSEKLKSIPVTKLKKLGTQVPTFEMPVTITKLDGTRAEITFQCKAMRKAEWAKVRDARAAAALEAVNKPAPVVEDAQGTVISQAVQHLKARGFEATVIEGMARDAATITEFARGWDLEDEFNAESLVAMEDEFGGSLIATVTAFDAAIFQGRQGNW